MRPIRTEQTNFVYKLEGGTEENDLPCVTTPLGCISTWEPEDYDDALAIGDMPMSPVRICIKVWGDYATVSEHLVIRFSLRGSPDALEAPLWMQAHDGGAVAAQPLTDAERLQITQDGSVDLFIAARPIPPVRVWTAVVGPCEHCGADAIHPCPCTQE